MVLIAGSCIYGKTLRMIKEAAKVNSQILCATKKHARNISEISKKYGLKVKQPIIIGEKHSKD